LAKNYIKDWYDNAGNNGKGKFTTKLGVRYKNWAVDLAFTKRKIRGLEISWRF